ncbi:hypothetical protein PInf_014670 [Phytophthora infestans]|nr:hypothetical protein PInf_014670 [Phytophthora infestans]
MAEREVLSDEEEGRVFDRSLEGGVDEQLVSVLAAVERLERGGRVRISPDPCSDVEQSPGKSDGAAVSQGVATMRMSSGTDVLRELYADELKETGKGASGRTETTTEVKDEPEMKREVAAGVATRIEGPYTTDGYDSEYYDAKDAYDSEYDSKYEQDEVVKSERKPSGFRSRHTGPEVRQSDRPAFGWSWNAQREESGVGGLRGGYGPGMAAKILVPTSSENEYDARKRGYGNGKKQEASAQTNGSCSLCDSIERTLRTADPFQLSQLVSNDMKVLPVLYSDTATVEKACDFWERFEAHTEGLPDRSRLLVFRQRLKGREAERWWERLETTKREKGESVEEWGDRVSDLCGSSDYPNPQMRFQLFRRGLRNKRMLATLDASPASDIPEACERLLFKNRHRPIKEDDEFSDEAPSKKRQDTPVLASVDALAQQMKRFMPQQQHWQQQLAESMKCTSVPS